MERRPGLPRPVDSQLFFLARTRLGRELSEGERVALMRRFREGVGRVMTNENGDAFRDNVLLENPVGSY